jgi:hypothetical protein
MLKSCSITRGMETQGPRAIVVNEIERLRAAEENTSSPPRCLSLFSGLQMPRFSGFSGLYSYTEVS